MKELQVVSMKSDILVRYARAVTAVKAVKNISATIQVYAKYQNPELCRIYTGENPISVPYIEYLLLYYMQKVFSLW